MVSSGRQLPGRAISDWLKQYLVAAACCCASMLLAGCAEPPKKLDFQLEDPERSGTDGLFWPEAEVPRYSFVGDLLGESNFMDKSRGRRQGFQRLITVLAGLDSSQPDQVMLQRPQSGVVDQQSRIYITDISRQAVFVFDQKSGDFQVWERASSRLNFGSPVGIAIGIAGDILVADSIHGEVFRLDRSGNPLGSFGAGILQRPTGLALDPSSGLIYVSDTAAHNIKVFDNKGNLVDTIGQRGNLPGEFNGPTFLAFADGRLVVSDTLNARVQILSAYGEVEFQIGKRGLYVGDLTRPKGVAVDSEGNIYVVESYYDHLLIFDKNGRFLLPIGGGGYEPGQFFLPAGVWVDGNNRVFVADMLNGRVSVFQYLGDG